MLIFSRFHVIGILLFLFHTTRSFVLLTANIDDVKRLASKFVSESMAEKIADFIAKATEHMITNVSEEIVIDQVSEENNRYNIARQRKETNEKINADLSSYEALEPDIKPRKLAGNAEHVKTMKPRYTDNYRQDNNIKYSSKPETVRFVTMKERQNIQSQYVKASRDNSMKVQPKFVAANEPESQYYKPEVNGPMDSQYAQSKLKPKPKPGHQSKDVSTIGYAERIVQDFDVATKKLKTRISNSRVHKTVGNKQLEVIESDDPNKNNTDGSILRAIKDPTTQRIRNEFDQYDNIHYPKPDFVATSGPVALLKIPSNKKWLEEDEDDSKQSWF